MFMTLVKDQAAVIRQKVLETLATETERAVRNKISDAVAEVARQYAEQSESPSSTSRPAPGPRPQVRVI